MPGERTPVRRVSVRFVLILLASLASLSAAVSGAVADPSPLSAQSRAQAEPGAESGVDPRGILPWETEFASHREHMVEMRDGVK
ncbi:MAG: hypothetical protein ACLFWG_02460, partial [Longimicrobiales bacterium]